MKTFACRQAGMSSVRDILVNKSIKEPNRQQM
jgi:hypothetical protein